MVVHHPLFARVFDRASRAMETGGFTEHRTRVLHRLSGMVVEIGAGNGLNFPHYPATVERLVAIEPEPYLRRRAIDAASRAPVSIHVVDGTAERLPLSDRNCDAVVASLVLCTVADQPRALAEALRVLRPGGELRFLEHVLADSPRLARVQRALDPLWTKIAGGCHLTRDTTNAISHAGFDIDRVERFCFPDDGPPFPTAPHVVGRAIRPPVDPT
jgi:ubiquinone/menaquinone biosynthesis C-methylase UbiE